ncbi:Peptidyl-prolyl cis-trans isomerase-like 4 [Desmophyllum pertusum]|uniref:Peptidyl-prolyl cis-trans isomerase n=1 Tax=Desmophyllum pertusum TaxID=174260 RepID=A0A9W9YRJ3_9CNID|nr:Peptidyl-prolyl cis-trans isomerase-like 4 [Desmophyllum pertusum]
MSVLLETTLGDIVIDLFTDDRPRACLNFLKLCKIKYYNYCLFHSVQQNFLAQTGDPTGHGTGGEAVFRCLYGDQAKFFEAEIKPRIKHKTRGTVSMANNGDNLHGSQFFITLGDDLDYLDGVHTVFGEVVEGFDILDKLNEAICDDEHRPYQDIRINHTVILDDPFDDPSGLVIPDRSPEPTKEQLDSGRIGADEEIDDTKGKTAEEVDEMIEQRELKAGTQILEMVGDLPDADIKPPDNVLFVCKLNPVTQDQDLEIIFGRFGAIKSCEVIREQKTEESLQYAFIEFENAEDCERAYFKMDNVLIDDRRIHVDFSQSVAKVQLQKQGAKPVFPDKGDKDKPKFAIKTHKETNDYELVFDDDGHHKKSGEKPKQQKERNYSDDNTSKPRNEGDRKVKRYDDDDHKRNKKQGEKDRDGRRERKASYNSDENRRERGKRDKRERRRSSDSSDDDERIKRKKKSQADDYSRSHRHIEGKHPTEPQVKTRDHKHRRDRDHSPRNKERHSKHDQDKQKHSEGHKRSSHDHKHHSSHRY